MKTYKQLWMKKYTPVLIIVLLVLTAILYGIRNGRSNGKGGNILAGASPDTSAFQMYYFDGETVAVRTLYDRGKEKKLIKKSMLFLFWRQRKAPSPRWIFLFTGSGAAIRTAMIFPWQHPAVSGLRMTGRFMMGIRSCLFCGNRWKAMMRTIP